MTDCTYYSTAEDTLNKTEVTVKDGREVDTVTESTNYSTVEDTLNETDVTVVDGW